MKDPGEFFPGDPPLFDDLVLLCGLVFCVSALGGLVSHLLGWRSASRTSVTVAIIAIGPVAWFWAERHSGPWRGFQQKLRSFEGEALRVFTACDQNFDCAVDALDQQYGTTWYRFTPEHRPVRLYLRPDASVAVDFGNGGTAVFDSTWMFTTYSD